MICLKYVEKKAVLEFAFLVLVVVVCLLRFVASFAF